VKTAPAVETVTSSPSGIAAPKLVCGGPRQTPPVMIGVPNPGTMVEGGGNDAGGFVSSSLRTRSKPLRFPVWSGFRKVMVRESPGSQAVGELVSAVLHVTLDAPMSMRPPSATG